MKFKESGKIFFLILLNEFTLIYILKFTIFIIN